LDFAFLNRPFEMNVEIKGNVDSRKGNRHFSVLHELDVCVTVHYQYDVNNQQDATTFRSLIFLNQPYMFRATDSPILRSTF